jgi:hypothetical protein
MSMYKRPSPRVKCLPPIRGDKPVEGSFLYDIIHSKPPNVYEFRKRPIYKKEDYLKALKRNHEQLGIPYTEPELPEPTSIVPPSPCNEPELIYGDRVGVSLRILKNGTIRIRVSGGIATMYEKYYRHGIQPPLKVILQAYKSHGFSREFLEKIKKSHEKKMIFAKKVSGILAKIFDKEPTKKPKKEKKKEKKEEHEEENVDLPEEEHEDDIPLEEGELDVEPDEEEDIEEEEYVSDNET